MNIVFFGSSKYSTIDEKALFDALGISLVITTPDLQDTKTKQLIPNPVKDFAQKRHIPCITTEKITDGVIEEITKYQPDFLLTADIRLILPKKLISLPKKAALNVHHSLLPKFRGPAPVPFTILSGEEKTGVTIILVSEKVDAGDILAQETYKITSEDTTDSVLTRLNELGSQLAVKVLTNFDEYYRNRRPQDESHATYSHYMTRQDGYIDLAHIENLSPVERENLKLEIARKVRAFYPWPGVWTKMRIKDKEVRIKLFPASSHPELISGSQPYLFQAEGKKPVNYKDFVNGYPETKEFLEKLGLV